MTYKGLPFPDIDPVAVHIGGFGLRWYSLAYLAGIVLAWFLARRMVRRYPNPVTEIMVDDVIFWATVGLITGGRLGYVLFYNLSYYAENPLQIFALWKGGMSFHGGLIGVITAVCLYARSVKVSFFQFTDILACVAPIGLFFGRLANFANSELYGRVTVSVPWAVIFPNGGPLPRHPSQLYEAGFEGLLLFCVLYFLWTCSVWVRIRPGFLSGLFLFSYAIVRSVIENFREPDAQIRVLFARVTMGQMLTVPMLIGGAWIMIWAAKKA